MSIVSLFRYPFFIFSVFLSAQLLFATEEVFDETYKVTITRCFGSVWEPDECYNEKWEAHNFIQFDNGLYGIHTSYWDSEAEAEEASEYEREGCVNIVYSPHDDRDGDFSLIYEEDKEPTRIELWVDRFAKRGKLPRLISITENMPSLSSYAYVIALNDHSSWLTKTSPLPWVTSWETGARIMKIGNSFHPCLINIDATLEEDCSVIRPSHYLPDVELL